MKIAFLGDIALFGRFTAKEDYEDYFSEIKDILSSCKYVVANLETPLTNIEKTIGGRSAYIKGSPNDSVLLEYLNITHVNLANNHIFDYCEEGVAETVNALKKRGIESFGIGSKCCLLSDCFNKLALRGYCCYSTNGRKIGNSDNRVNALEYNKVMNDLEKDHKDGVRTILSIHWGTEHVHYPSIEQVKFAHCLADKYNVIVHGHHPHVIQGIEKKNNSLIMYSLGNFCFDDVYTTRSDKPLIRLSKDNKTTFIMIVDLKDNDIKSIDIIPVSFDEGKHAITDIQQLCLEELSGYFNDLDRLNLMKSKEFSDYIANHRKERDLKWYLTRLNFESTRILYYEHICSKKYMREFKNKLC